MPPPDDGGEGPAVAVKKKKKALPTPHSLVRTSIRKIETKSTSNDPDDSRPIKKKVTKHKSTLGVIPKSNQDSGTSLQFSQSSGSTDETGGAENNHKYVVPKPVKKRPTRKQGTTATPAAVPIKKHPPKKHPPQNPTSPQKPASKRKLGLESSPSSAGYRAGMVQKVSTSDLLSSGRSSPADNGLSASANNSKQKKSAKTLPTSAANDIVENGRGKGTTEPSTRGMKRYGSMPTMSTAAKAKKISKTKKKSSADDSALQLESSTVEGLASIQERRSTKMLPKAGHAQKGKVGSNKSKSTKSSPQKPETSSPKNEQLMSSFNLSESIRRLPFFNLSSGEPNASERSNRSGSGRSGSGRKSPKMMMSEEDDSVSRDGRNSPMPGFGIRNNSKNSVQVSPKTPQENVPENNEDATANSAASTTLAGSTRRLGSSLAESIRKLPFLNPITAKDGAKTIATPSSSLKSGSGRTNTQNDAADANDRSLSPKLVREESESAKLASPKKKGATSIKASKSPKTDFDGSSDGNSPKATRGQSVSTEKSSPNPPKPVAGSLKASATQNQRPACTRIPSERSVSNPTEDTIKSGNDSPIGEDSFNTSPEQGLRQPRRGMKKDSLRPSSMMNLTSPSGSSKTKNAESSIAGKGPPIGRRLPDRTRSSDLESMRTRREQKKEAGVVVSRQIPQRSQSGDLELFSETSMHARTGIQIPTSILKNSSHHRASILRNSSHHTAAFVPRKDPTARARFPDILPSSSDDDDDDDKDEFGDDDSSIEEISLKFEKEPAKPRSARPGLGSRHGIRPGMKKTKSLADLSSLHSFKSTRSIMSIDKEEKFPGDPAWKRCLRYIRILPPHSDEKVDRKWIRIYVWFTLLLDFIAAMVSITTYTGVTMCCGVPIFSLSFVDVNWGKAIRITTYVYLIMIFAEILPVVRKGLPFNLINPLVGFTITFAMFFDDRILEAVCMWIIEATAIICEFMTYRLQGKIYNERHNRLEAVDKDLSQYSSSRNLTASKRGALCSTHSRRGLNSSHSKRHALISSSSLVESDDDSLSGHSFGDDETDIEEQLNGSSKLPQSRNHKLREARLLRERRILRQRQAAERLQLRYHFAGVVINFGLMCISLIFIVVIASSGGLCIRSDSRPVVFDMNQLDKCGDCRGQIVDGKCEICEPNGLMQCYYQYI